jgi:hypothetical protein
MVKGFDGRPASVETLFLNREICITAEKWFVSGESNVFRISSEDVNGSFYIMITTGRLLSGKDF